MSKLDLWAGVECTVNRVGDQYFSQLERNGHDVRIDDLDRIAALGVRALRYPVIWERTAPDGLDQADWRWADERLGRLRELGVTPIAGLIHHGSGPQHTSLVSPCFAEKLAEYAGAVARRYPWLEFYTPVNEPLTTARFSGLYGVWYPHGRDPAVFKEALLNQCRAVVLAMREIRKVNPAAKLVQTDDLGKYYGTPLLAYQVAHNNEQRWLSWDLLFGRVGKAHPLWEWLTTTCRATESELAWFAENPCPPDIVGCNYYVTSERYIDERLDQFPERYHGGNSRHRYADLETARCLSHPAGGLRDLLLEAWQRYRAPLAVTELQLDASRDDQVRWFAEQWRGAQSARDAGADVRAVTAWALFGSFDWNCLVAECRGYYEPGAFDVRSGKPRPTAVAGLMRDLGAGRTPDHPVLEGPGWWLREGRHFCRPITLPGRSALKTAPEAARPILITGATGTLGAAFARACDRRGLAYRLLGRRDLDIANARSIGAALERHEPWAVLNAAGYVRVDEAERDPDRCFRENTFGADHLARACARARLPLVTFSTDLVFDGRKRTPYEEDDAMAPLNVYGLSKALAEGRVLERHPESLVVRTSAFFGPWDAANFITVALRALRSGNTFTAAGDVTVSPTYVPDLANACLDLLIDGEQGIWHLTNGEAVTWSGLVRLAAQAAGVQAGGLREVSSAELGLVAARPSYSAMRSARATLMPTLHDALARYCADCQAHACATMASKAA
ncbi:MAG TPA: family 1 glycosylhydrolase [Burkholderiales bacterium]|nr:family 1 glycosylhydrolase [Burkholderiales bacterium]